MKGEVLYTCSYVPEEIILAAGLVPRRFLPAEAASETWIHPNACGYVKSILPAALENEAGAGHWPTGSKHHAVVSR